MQQLHNIGWDCSILAKLVRAPCMCVDMKLHVIHVSGSKLHSDSQRYTTNAYISIRYT